MVDLIKINNLKKHFNNKGFKISKELNTSINDEIEQYLNKVLVRTKLNNRTTVLTRDL